MKLIRQGDVLLVPAKLPKNAVQRAAGNDVVLKRGEATGHAHRIAESAKVRIWDAGAERYLQVLEAVSLKHEEHTALTIPPGIYHLPEQVEWTDDDEPRIVAD